MQLKSLSTLTFKTDCLHASIQVKDQKKRVQFLKFLVYVCDLEYDCGFLGTTRYRRVTFRLNNFLKKIYDSDGSSTYKLNQVRDFCHQIQNDFWVTSFDDRHFQRLVAVPQVELYEEKEWKEKFWILDDLFYYNYLFSLPDMFRPNLSKYEFSVLSEILKCFNSPNIEKRIDLKRFLHDFPSTLSNQTIQKMRILFLKAIQILEINQLIESRFKVFDHGTLESVEKLGIDNISEGFVIYEKVNIFQLPDLE